MAFIRSVIAIILIFAEFEDDLRRFEYLRGRVGSVLDSTYQKPSTDGSIIEIGCMNQEL